jgi:biopolymer transport protein ExbD
MAFGDFEEDSSNKPLSEINIIPLVDVMLVLLILFIITAPLFTPHAIKIDVPKASNEKISTQPDKIILAIDDKGELFWNDKAIDDKTLTILLNKAVQKEPIPELHLRADKKTYYQRIAEIMSATQKAGINHLVFITEPKK